MPKDDASEYIDHLENWESESIRIDAAKKLGKLGERKAVGPLIKVLQEENVPIQLEVAVIEALGNLNDPQSVSPLIQHTCSAHGYHQVVGWEESSRQDEVVAALEKMDRLVVAKTLLDSMDSGVNEQIRNNAVRYAVALVAVIKELPEASRIAMISALLNVLKEETKKKVRIKQETGRLPRHGNIPGGVPNDMDQMAISFLNELTDTILTLSAAEHDTVVEGLIQIVESETEYTVRNDCAALLGDLKDKRAVNAVSNMPQSEETVVALGKLEDKRAIPRLVRILEGYYPQDEISHEEAYRGLGEEKRIAELQKAQTLAAQVLGRLGDPMAIPALISLADATIGEYRWSKHAADPALISTLVQVLGEFRSVEPVESLLRCGSRVRQEVKLALRKIAQANDISELLVEKLMKDADVGVRSVAAGALGCYKSQRVFDALVVALKDVPSVATNAATALGEIGNREAVKYLKQAIRDWSKTPEDSRAAIKSGKAAIRKLSWWNHLLGN